MAELRDRLQSHLAIIRNCAGWSTTKLGDMLGVTRQMVSNLETGKSRMTQLQYLAIRKVVDDEIAASPKDTEMLSLILKVLVDQPEAFSNEERDTVLSKAKLIAPAIMKKPSERREASDAWKAILGASGVAVSALLIAFIKEKDK